VVALEHKVLVYDFKDLKLLHSIETLSNPLGLVALSPSQDQTVMACPGLHCGQVCTLHFFLYLLVGLSDSTYRALCRFVQTKCCKYAEMHARHFTTACDNGSCRSGLSCRTVFWHHYMLHGFMRYLRCTPTMLGQCSHTLPQTSIVSWLRMYNFLPCNTHSVQQLVLPAMRIECA